MCLAEGRLDDFLLPKYNGIYSSCVSQGFEVYEGEEVNEGVQGQKAELVGHDG